MEVSAAPFEEGLTSLELKVRTGGGLLQLAFEVRPEEGSLHLADSGAASSSPTSSPRVSADVVALVLDHVIPTACSTTASRTSSCGKIHVDADRG